MKCCIFKVIILLFQICLVRTKKSNDNENQVAGCNGAIILKYARSGSTWFASKLRNFDDMHVIEEGISFHQGKNYSTSQKTMYLLNILRHAVRDKIKVCADKTKCTSQMMRPNTHWSSQIPVITMEPIYSKKLDYRHICEQTQSKLVVYVRSNAVKMAIANIHAHDVYTHCDGKNNIRASYSSCLQNVRKIIDNSAESLLRHTLNVPSHNELLIDRAEASKMPYHVVIYERLQADEQAELNALRSFLGLKKKEVEGLTNLQKTTPDDLRLTLKNYDAFASLLVQRGSRDGASQQEKEAYACLSRMLAAKNPVDHFPFCLPTSKNMPKSLRPRDGDKVDEPDEPLVQLRTAILGTIQKKKGT